MNRFKIEQINMVDGETALVIDQSFCDALSTALQEARMPGGQVDPALMSLGCFIRDCGSVLRGVSLTRFPLLMEINRNLDGELVSNESNYVD